MSVAYVDTSCLVAIAFGEKGATPLARRLDGFAELVSSNLLEAELRASFEREKLPADARLLNRMSWILPDRPLSNEITEILAVGYLRGADLWHVACARYLAGRVGQVSFVTLGGKQRTVAERLGFRV